MKKSESAPMMVGKDTSFDPASGNVAPELRKLRVMIHNFCKVSNGSLLDDIDMRKYGMDSGTIVNNTTIQELCAIHNNILNLSLVHCNQVSDVGLWAIAKHCIRLRTLNCFGCDKITSVGIRSISLRCSEMVELDLSHCNLLDDTSLTIIAGGTWELQKLSLQGCTKISDNGLAKIAVGLGPYLLSLNLNSCPNIGEFGDRGLKEIGTHCHLLLELLIDKAKRIEDAGVITLSKGSPDIQTIFLSGCENLGRKGLKSMAESFSMITLLTLLQNRKLSDMDFTVIVNSPLAHSLQSLTLDGFENLSDKGIVVICKALTQKNRLRKLSLLHCHLLTDYACFTIANLLGPFNLRELDLRFCGQFSDESIHAIARKTPKLTTLKLDGNHRITTRALLIHIDRELEFVEMANNWVGYEPKPAVEKLIAQKDEFLIKNQLATKIQCMIRRRFADRIYWTLYQQKLIERSIPIFQSHVRAFFQRRRFKVIQKQLLRIRSAVKIQCKFRKFAASRAHMLRIKQRKYREYLNRLARLIQRLYRGWQGRKTTEQIRVSLANKRIEEGRQRAMQEVKAAHIQKVYRGHFARVLAYKLQLQRLADEKQRRLENRSVRLIQRIAHGKLGRIKMQRRRYEVLQAKIRWHAARDLQRVYRGHVGRLRFKYFKALEELRRRNHMATQIQRVYRGYRGRLLGSVAKALLLLRSRQQFCALELQRFLRGCMGRHYFALHKERVLEHRKRVIAAILLQRIFRGHKGRESREIETALQKLEDKAKPLFDHLHKKEFEALKLRKLVKKLESQEKMLQESVFEIERELDRCMKTTSKYMDSTRINDTPQRFLTKFLQVRLKDHFEHELEAHKVKYKELQVKRAELRDVDKDIYLSQRELIPLTTGLIAKVKRERTARLRETIWRRRNGATVIQAIWRRALVRSALYDEFFEGWVERYDKEQSDKPYYLNTISKEIVWKKPLAYMYFGERSVSAMDALNHHQQTSSNMHY